MMLAPVVHILPLTTIRRERTLPVPGRVLVRQGLDQVHGLAEVGLALAGEADDDVSGEGQPR